MNQYGGGKCAICGSPNTNRTNCPRNVNALNPDYKKHPLASAPATELNPKPKQKQTVANKELNKAKTYIKEHGLLQLVNNGKNPENSSVVADVYGMIQGQGQGHNVIILRRKKDKTLVSIRYSYDGFPQEIYLFNAKGNGGLLPEDVSPKDFIAGLN